VLITDAVPVLVVEILGEAPLRFNTVALVAVIVAFPTVSVPVLAPILRVVAAPAKFTVVLRVFHKATVVLLLAVRIVGKFKLSVPRIAEAVALPTLTFVVEPAAPAVAKLRVFVVAVAVALPNRVAVRTVVGVPPKVKVVAAPNSVTVVATVLKFAKVVEAVTTEVVNDGEVIVCTPVKV